jgi:hypothetical protein
VMIMLQDRLDSVLALVSCVLFVCALLCRFISYCQSISTLTSISDECTVYLRNIEFKSVCHAFSFYLRRSHRHRPVR